MRAQSLQELVYKQGSAGITKATVSIVFHNNDPQNGPSGYEDKEYITVTRQVRHYGTAATACWQQSAMQQHTASLESLLLTGWLPAADRHRWKGQVFNQWTCSTARVSKQRQKGCAWQKVASHGCRSSRHTSNNYIAAVPGCTASFVPNYVSWQPQARG